MKSSPTLGLEGAEYPIKHAIRTNSCEPPTHLKIFSGGFLLWGEFMGGKKHQVNEFDICVGRVMVMLRARMGMTQRELGDKIGVTFQQIHKYESGQCRISAALLNELCHIFEISPSAFFTESNADYIHDKPMADLITLIYKLPGKKRDVIAKIAVALNVAD